MPGTPHVEQCDCSSNAILEQHKQTSSATRGCVPRACTCRLPGTGTAETPSNQHITDTLAVSPFIFSFFLLSFFFLRFSSPFLYFSVFPFLVPFCSFCPFCLVVLRLFLVSPSSLFFPLPCFPWWRILFICYFVSAIHPLAFIASLKYAYSPCVLSFLALLMLTYLTFSYLPSLFRFRLGHRLLHPVFFLWLLCCLLGFGLCCNSFNIRMICIPIRTHADLTFYFCLRYTICFSYVLCVLSSVFYLFCSSGNLPLQSYWSLSCDHGLHCSDEL